MMLKLIWFFMNIRLAMATPNFWAVTKCYIGMSNEKYQTTRIVSQQYVFWLRFKSSENQYDQLLTMSQEKVASEQCAVQITQGKSDQSIYFSLQLLDDQYANHQYHKFAKWHTISITIIQDQIVYQLYSNDTFDQLNINQANKLQYQHLIYFYHPNFIMYFCQQTPPIFDSIQDLYNLFNYHYDFNHTFQVISEKQYFQTNSIIQLNESYYEFWMRNYQMNNQIQNSILQFRVNIYPIEQPQAQQSLFQMYSYKKYLSFEVSDDELNQSHLQTINIESNEDFQSWILVNLEFQYNLTNHNVIIQIITKTNHYDIVFQTHILYYPNYELFMNLTYWRIDNLIYLQNSKQKSYLAKDFYEDFNYEAQMQKILTEGSILQYSHWYLEFLINKSNYYKKLRKLALDSDISITFENNLIVQKIHLMMTNYIVHQDLYLTLDQYINLHSYQIPHFIHLDYIDIYIDLLSGPNRSKEYIIPTLQFKLDQIYDRNINLTFDFQLALPSNNIILLGLTELSIVNLNFQFEQIVIIANVVRLVNITTKIALPLTRFSIYSSLVVLHNIHLTGVTKDDSFCILDHHRQIQPIQVLIDNFTLNSTNLKSYVLLNFIQVASPIDITFNDLLINNSILNQFRLVYLPDNIRGKVRINNLQILNTQFIHSLFLWVYDLHIENILIRNSSIYGRQQLRFIAAQNLLSLVNFSIINSTFIKTSYLFFANSVIMNKGLVHQVNFYENSVFLITFKNENIIQNIHFSRTSFNDCVQSVFYIQGNQTFIEDFEFKYSETGSFCQLFDLNSEQISITNIYIQQCSLQVYPFIYLTQDSESLTQQLNNLTFINLELLNWNKSLPFVQINSTLNNFLLQDIRFEIDRDIYQNYLIDITAKQIEIKNSIILINNQQTIICFALNAERLELQDIYLSHEMNNRSQYLFTITSNIILITNCFLKEISYLINATAQINSRSIFKLENNVIMSSVYNESHQFNLINFPLVSVQNIKEIQISNNQINFQNCYSTLFSISDFDFVSVWRNTIQTGYNFIQCLARKQDSVVQIINNSFSSEFKAACCQICQLIQAQYGQLIVDNALIINSSCALLDSVDQAVVVLHDIQVQNVNYIAKSYISIQSSMTSDRIQYSGQQIQLEHLSIKKAKFNQNNICSLSILENNRDGKNSLIQIILKEETQYLELSKIELSQNKLSYSQKSSLINIYYCSNILIQDLLLFKNHCGINCLNLESYCQCKTAIKTILFYQNVAQQIISFSQIQGDIDGLIMTGSDFHYPIMNNKVALQSTLTNAQIYLKARNCIAINDFIITETCVFCWNALNFNQEQLYLSLDDGRSYFRNQESEKNKYTSKIEAGNKISNQFYIPTGQLFKEYQRLVIENNTIQYKYYNLQFKFKYQSKYRILDNINCYLLTSILNEDNLNNQSFILQNQNWDDFLVIAPPQKLVHFVLNCVIDTLPRQLTFKGKIFDCQVGEILVNQSQCLLCHLNQNQYSILKKSTQCKSIDQRKVMRAKFGNIELKPGFWRPSFQSDEIGECLSKQQSCLGGLQVNYFSCNVGYIGALCSQCDYYNIRGNGRFRMDFNQQCIICEQSQEDIVLKLTVIILIFQALSQFSVSAYIKYSHRIYLLQLTNRFYKILVKHQVDELAVYILILFDYLNLITSMFKMVSFKILYVNQLQIIIDSILGIQLILQCSINQYVMESELIFSDMTLFFIIGIYLVYAYMFMILPFKDRFKFKRIRILILYLIQTQLVNYMQKLLMIIIPIKISGIYWIQAQMTHKYSILGLQTTSIVVAQFIFMFFCLIAVIWYRKDDINQHNIALQYFAYSYKQDKGYWISINVILLFMTFLSFSALNLTPQMCIVVFITQQFRSQLVEYFQPYKLKQYNKVVDRTIQLFCIQLIILSSQNITDFTQQTINIISIIITAIGLLLFIQQIFYILKQRYQIFVQNELCNFVALISLGSVNLKFHYPRTRISLLSQFTRKYIIKKRAKKDVQKFHQ